MSEIVSHLAQIREQRGLAASELARAVGVTRQTIYALEAGTYVPNTTVALRLARALSVKIEEIFTLAEPPVGESRKAKVTVLDSIGLQPGQAMQLCRVDEKLIAIPAGPPAWYLPEIDAALETAPVHDKASVNLSAPKPDFTDRLLLAGCDPALGLLASFLQRAGVQAVLLHRNSSESLSLLKSGLIHVAGSHLHDAESGESNLAAIHCLFPTHGVSVVSFALGQEGIVTTRGNPKKIRTIADLARKDIMIVNREPGSGSRTLLESQLKGERLNPKLIRGYNRIASGHLAAVWEVKTGSADCCIATETTARLFGLHFIPLQSVRYDFAVRKRHLKLPAVQALFNVINQSRFRSTLDDIGGYDTAVTGTRIH